MTGVLLTQAGVQAPLLAFVPDDDVFPFETFVHLLAKARWWVGQDRHVGIEIVDRTGSRWVMSRLTETEGPRRKWWQFGVPAGPRLDIEVEPRDPEPFAETRGRVDRLASGIFPPGDDALDAIRAATGMGELSEACFEITVRAQGLRILAGDSGIAVRPAADVARRVIILFAFVRMAMGVARRTAVGGMDESLTEAISPAENALLASRRWTEEQVGDAGWNIESLVVLMWALNLFELPLAGELIDFEAIEAIVPPTADADWRSFVSGGMLRPAAEIAGKAEAYWRDINNAAGDHAADGPERAANIARSSYLRFVALTWVLNPNRLAWE